MKVTIYTDGACKGNPGAGGWAMQVHKDGMVKYTKSGGLKQTTNNEMELTAIYNALDWIMDNLFFEHLSEVEIISDSKYSIQCITEWGPSWIARGITNKANYELIKDCIDILNTLTNALFVKVKFTHVNGHVGIPGNESVDKVASEEAEYYKTH